MSIVCVIYGCLRINDKQIRLGFGLHVFSMTGVKPMMVEVCFQFDDVSTVKQ